MQKAMGLNFCKSYVQRSGALKPDNTVTNQMERTQQEAGERKEKALGGTIRTKYIDICI